MAPKAIFFFLAALLIGACATTIPATHQPVTAVDATTEAEIFLDSETPEELWIDQEAVERRDREVHFQELMSRCKRGGRIFCVRAERILMEMRSENLRRRAKLRMEHARERQRLSLQFCSNGAIYVDGRCVPKEVHDEIVRLVEERLEEVRKPEPQRE